MTLTDAPEVWLRGPISGFEPLLMPVVHALLQVREDVARLGARVDEPRVWERPGGAASIGYHLRHTGGALDRLFTYARGEALNEEQLDRMRTEGDPGTPPETLASVVSEVESVVDRALEQLRQTAADALLVPRGVGRRQLPSTTLGLLFHAAEHSTRHVGQAITTARILSGR
jgi:uncharacterized damage-inducible protein DinB